VVTVGRVWLAALLPRALIGSGRAFGRGRRPAIIAASTEWTELM
jgi:hypothetical protein